MKKTNIKRITALILAVLLIPGISLLCTAFAGSDEITFAVATDIHIENTKTEIDVNYPESELYFNASGTGNLYDQAAAMTKDFLYKSADEGASFILITGDLTRHGNDEEHSYVSALLSDFENETGIEVYVVPGNHDYYSSFPDDFKKYYAALGYDEALEIDSETASYTADIAEGYRLIAIDSNNPGVDGDGITESLLSWIEMQTEKAEKDGRRIIYMMHHSLLEHLYKGKLLMKDFVVRNSEDIAESFTQWGIEYVFTGHEHGNDIASYQGKNGRKVYDILTTALSSYPLEYRMVTLSEIGADISMRKIDKCDMDALIPGYTDAQKALLESDYEAYAYGYFKFAIEKKILKYTSPGFIKNKLNAQSGPLSAPLDILFTAVTDALTMPLYDSGDGSVSIEKLASSKGVNIPGSGYTSLIELASSLVAAHYYGDENLTCADNVEAEILIKGLNTGLEYILSRSGRSGLNLLLETIGITTPVDTGKLSPMFTAVSLGKEDSYKVAEKVLYPLLDKFSVDFSEPDRDTFLPANSTGNSQAQSSPVAAFFEKILAFFKRILSLLQF